MNPITAVLLVADGRDDRAVVDAAAMRANISVAIDQLDSDVALDQRLSESIPDLLVLRHSPAKPAMTVLVKVRELCRDLPVVILLAEGEAVTAVDLMKAGAADCVFDGDESRLTGVLSRLEGTSSSQRPLPEKDFLHLVDEQMPAVLWAVDLDLRFTASVGAGLGALGLEPGEVVGLSLREYLGTEDDDHAVVDATTRALEGRSETFESSFAGSTYRNSVRPLFDREGEIVGAVGLSQDITDLRRTESALKEREVLYRTLVETSPHGIQISDLDGVIMFSNRAHHQIHGYADGEIVGRRIWDFALDEEGRAATEAYYRWSVTEEPEPGVYVTQNRRKDGSVNDILVHWNYLRDEKNQVTSIFGMITDITDLKKAEREAEIRQRQLMQADKMASLGILVSGIAHEINNPNHFILANSELLGSVWRSATPILERQLAEDDQTLLGGIEFADLRDRVPVICSHIADGSKRIKAIVTALRDFASESPAPLREEVQINPVVAAAVLLLSPMIDRATAWFSVEYGGDLPTVQGNRQQLEQVVINLVQNACQALTNREQAIRVITESDGHELIVRVEDEGCGIEPGALDRITDPFFTTKREQGGTGLGLSISQSIVRNHGGELEFAARAEGGTAATVRLPLAAVDEAE